MHTRSAFVRWRGRMVVGALIFVVLLLLGIGISVSHAGEIIASIGWTRPVHGADETQQEFGIHVAGGAEFPLAPPAERPDVWRRGGDSNPRNACAFNGFRDRPVQPLRHLSEGAYTRVSGAFASPRASKSVREPEHVQNSGRSVCGLNRSLPNHDILCGIGIGDSGFPAIPLPHHQTCGSASGERQSIRRDPPPHRSFALIHQ